MFYHGFDVSMFHSEKKIKISAVTECKNFQLPKTHFFIERQTLTALPFFNTFRWTIFFLVNYWKDIISNKFKRKCFTHCIYFFVLCIKFSFFKTDCRPLKFIFFISHRFNFSMTKRELEKKGFAGLQSTRAPLPLEVIKFSSSLEREEVAGRRASNAIQ